MHFRDRSEAGRALAGALTHLADRPVTVLGLPRGGVPVAAIVAETLHAPLDVLVVRKIGTPSQPELAMGAVGEDLITIRNDDVIRAARVSPTEFSRAEVMARIELERRSRRYRRTCPRLSLAGTTAVVIDDGVATGSTAQAACQVARAAGADAVVLAVPVAPQGWHLRMGDAADEYIAVSEPTDFHAVGQYYDDFSQISDVEVERILIARHPAGLAAD
jgi:putative phosphoribosyl transferase